MKTIGMIENKVKEIILDYKKNNAKLGFYIISQMFGLSIETIMEIFYIQDYTIKKNSKQEVLIFNLNKHLQYEENKIKNIWRIYHFDNSGNIKNIQTGDGVDIKF